MKILKISIVLMLLIGTAGAQDAAVSSTAPDSAEPSGAPDLVVLKVSWKKIYRPGASRISGVTNPEAAAKAAVNTARMNEYKSARESGVDRPPPVLLPNAANPDPPPGLPPWSGFQYEFTVKNTGQRTMRQLYFEYSYKDPGTNLIVRRREYQSKVKIKPGMVGKLVVLTQAGPIGTVNVNQSNPDKQDESPDQVVMQKIKYSDGPEWINPVNKPKKH